MLPPRASLLFSRLSGLAATGPTLPFHVFPLSTQVSPVSHMASTSYVRFLALLRLSFALPDSILVPVPILIHIPISTIALVSVPTPLPVPIVCSSKALHLRPCPRPRPVPAPVPVPSAPSFASNLFPVPVPTLSPSPTPRSHLRSRPRLRSRSRPRSILPVFWTRLTPRCDARVQAPGLTNGAVGCP